MISSVRKVTYRSSKRVVLRDRVVRRHLENSNVPQLESPAWVSQREAARERNVAVLCIGLLIAKEHLAANEYLERNMGVTGISLDAERRWRQETPPAVRRLRPLRDSVNWF